MFNISISKEILMQLTKNFVVKMSTLLYLFISINIHYVMLKISLLVN